MYFHSSAEAKTAQEIGKYEQEKNRMSVIIKRLELKVNSLQNQVTEKHTENKELQKLIDHLTGEETA